MTIDSRNLLTGANLEADICIIGAGPAGIVMAMEFARSNAHIILLESGGHKQDARDRQLSEGENGGLPYYPISENRYRGLGGTTNLWAGWNRPLDPVDLEKRSWVRDSGWPIPYDQLWGYYKRAHEYFSLSEFNFQPEYWMQKYRVRKLPFITDPIELKIFQVNKGINFGYDFSEALHRLNNVQVILHATATTFLTEKKETHISGMVVLDRSKRKIVVRAKNYILACGGIENARMLLLSGVNRRIGLGNEYDQVGRYFMEHLHFHSGVIILKKPAGQFEILFSPRTRPVVGRLFLTEKIQLQQHLLNYNMVLEPVYWSSSKRSSRLCMRPITKGSNGGIKSGIWLRSLKDSIRKLKGFHAGYSLGHTQEQCPNPTSRICLGETRDKLGQFKARVLWELSDQDHDSYFRSRKEIVNRLVENGIGHFIPDPGQDQKWPPDPLQGSRGHHMGTTRMNEDPAKGVVDKNCKVHGIDNLFIAGSSVFPTSGSGTPTYTIAALAIRLADHLKPGNRG